MFVQGHRTSQRCRKIVEEVVMTKRKRSFKTDHRGASSYTRYVGKPYSYSQESYSKNKQPYNSSEYKDPRASQPQHSEFQLPNSHNHHMPGGQNERCCYAREYNHGYSYQTNKPTQDDHTRPKQSSRISPETLGQGKFNQEMKDYRSTKQDSYSRIMANLESFDSGQKSKNTKASLANTQTRNNLCSINQRKDYQTDDGQRVFRGSQAGMLGINHFTGKSQFPHHVSHVNDNIEFSVNNNRPIDKQRYMEPFCHNKTGHGATQCRGNHTLDTQQNLAHKYLTESEVNNKTVSNTAHKSYNERFDNNYSLKNQRQPESYGNISVKTDGMLSKQRYCQQMQTWQPWTDQQMSPLDISNKPVQHPMVSTTGHRWRAVPPPPLFINTSHGVIVDQNPTPPPQVHTPSHPHAIQLLPKQYSQFTEPPGSDRTRGSSTWPSDKYTQYKQDPFNDTSHMKDEPFVYDNHMHFDDTSAAKNGKNHTSYQNQTEQQICGISDVEKDNECKRIQKNASEQTYINPYTQTAESKYVSEIKELSGVYTNAQGSQPKHSTLTKHEREIEFAACNQMKTQCSDYDTKYQSEKMGLSQTVLNNINTTHISDNSKYSANTVVTGNKPNEGGKLEKNDTNCEMNRSWSTIPVACIPLPPEPMSVHTLCTTGLQLGPTLDIPQEKCLTDQLHASRLISALKPQKERYCGTSYTNPEHELLKPTMSFIQPNGKDVSSNHVKSMKYRNRANTGINFQRLAKQTCANSIDNENNQFHSLSAVSTENAPSASLADKSKMKNVPRPNFSTLCSDVQQIIQKTDSSVPLSEAPQKRWTLLQPPPPPHKLLNEVSHCTMSSDNCKPNNQYESTNISKQTNVGINSTCIIGDSAGRCKSNILHARHSWSGNTSDKTSQSNQCVTAEHDNDHRRSVQVDIGNPKVEVSNLIHQKSNPKQNLYRPWETEHVHNVHNMSVKYHYNRFMKPRLDSKASYSSQKDRSNVNEANHIFRPWCSVSEIGRASQPGMSKYPQSKKQINNGSVLLDSAIPLTDITKSRHIGSSVKSALKDASYPNADNSKRTPATNIQCKDVKHEKQCGKRSGKMSNNVSASSKTNLKPMPFTELTKLAKLNMAAKPTIQTHCTIMSTFVNSIHHSGACGNIPQTTAAKKGRRCTNLVHKHNEPSKTLDISEKINKTGSKRVSAVKRNVGNVKKKDTNLNAEKMRNTGERLKETGSSISRYKNRLPMNDRIAPFLHQHIIRSKKAYVKKLKVTSMKTKSNLELGSMQHLKELVAEIKTKAKSLEKSVHLPSLLRSGNGKLTSTIDKPMASQHPKLRHKFMKSPFIAESVNINKVDMETLPKPSIVVSRCDEPKIDTSILSAAVAEKLAKESILNYMKRRKSAVEQIADGNMQDIYSPSKKQKTVHFNDIVEHMESGLVEEINYKQKAQLSKVKPKHKTGTHANHKNVTNKENKLEREVDRQYGFVKRGRFVLQTPTTLIKLPSKPLLDKTKDTVPITPCGEPENDPLSQGLCSAKKYLLYRALASEALKRDSSKPISKKINKSNARISNCSLQIGKEIGDKLLEESSDIGPDLETLLNSNAEDSGSSSNIDGMSKSKNATRTPPTNTTCLNDSNTYVTTAVMSRTVLHTADTLTSISKIDNPCTSSISKRLDLPVVCSPFVKTSPILKRHNSDSPASVVSNYRTYEEHVPSDNRMVSSADSVVCHIDENNYSHCEYAEIKDVCSKHVQPENVDIEGECGPDDSPVLVIDDSKTNNNKLSETFDSNPADILTTLHNKGYISPSLKSEMNSTERQPPTKEKQKGSISFQEEWQDFCGKFVSVPVSYLEPISYSEFSYSQTNRDAIHIPDSVTTCDMVTPLKLPIVNDFKYYNKYTAASNKLDIEDDNDVPAIKCNKVDHESDNSRESDNISSTVKHCVNLPSPSAVVTTDNEKISSVIIGETDDDVSTAIAINTLQSPKVSETDSHSYPVSYPDPALSCLDNDSIPNQEIVQEGNYTDTKCNSIDMFESVSEANNEQKYVENVCPGTEQGKELPTREGAGNVSERNVFDAMIDKFMTDDTFWTQQPPELKVIDIAGVLKDEGPISSEQVLPQVHGDGEHLFHGNSLNQSVSEMVSGQSPDVPVWKTDTGKLNNSETIPKTQQLYKPGVSQPFKSARTPPRVADYYKRKYVKRFPQPLPKSKYKTTDQMLYDDAKTFLRDFSGGKRRRTQKNIAETVNNNSTSESDRNKPKAGGNGGIDILKTIGPVSGFLETVQVKSASEKQNTSQKNGTDSPHLKPTCTEKYLNNKDYTRDGQHSKSHSAAPVDKHVANYVRKQGILNNGIEKTPQIKCVRLNIKHETPETWKVETMKRNTVQSPTSHGLPIVKVKRIKTMSESDSDVQFVGVEEDAVTCQLCGETLKCEQSLRRHYLLAHDSWCIHCNKKFPNKDEKRKHFRKTHMVSTFCGICGSSTVNVANLNRHLKSASHLEKVAKLNMVPYSMQASEANLDIYCDRTVKCQTNSSPIQGSMIKEEFVSKVKKATASPKPKIKSQVCSKPERKRNNTSQNMKDRKSCKLHMNKKKPLTKSKIKKVKVQVGNGNKSPSLASKTKLQLAKGQKTMFKLVKKLNSRKANLKSENMSPSRREKKVWYCRVCDHWYTKKLCHLQTLKHDLAVKEVRRQRRVEKRAQIAAAANNCIASSKAAGQTETATQCDSDGSDTVPMPGPGLQFCNLLTPASPVSQQGTRCLDIPCPNDSVLIHTQGAVKLSPTFLFKNIANTNDGLVPARPDGPDGYQPMEEMLEYTGENPTSMANQRTGYQLQDGENFTNDTSSDGDDDTIYIYENLNNVHNICDRNGASTAAGYLQETGSIIKYSTDLTLDPGLVSDKIISEANDDFAFMQSVMSPSALTVVSMPSSVETNAPRMSE